MWDARNFMEQISKPTAPRFGYKFTCPKCRETLEIRTLKYDEEFRKQVYATYKYDVEENRWDEAGDIHAGTLCIHPSVVCVGCEQGGHYWVRDGKIINC